MEGATKNCGNMFLGLQTHCISLASLGLAHLNLTQLRADRPESPWTALARSARLGLARGRSTITPIPTIPHSLNDIPTTSAKADNHEV